MTFQVYLDKKLEQQMREFCQITHKKRNTIIREALMLYLKIQTKEVWPQSVLNFDGIKDFSGFELDREKDPLNNRHEFLD